MPTFAEIKEGFFKNKIGLAGLGILGILIIVSASTAIFIPMDTYKQWNNPSAWTTLPKTAMPAWVNFLSAEKIPEHQILDRIQTNIESGATSTTIQDVFEVDFEYDRFPNEFLFLYTAQYDGAPVMKITVQRPDGITLDLTSISLPKASAATFSDKVFSTNNQIRKNLQIQSTFFSYPVDEMTSKEIIFSKATAKQVLKGKYHFFLTLENAEPHVKLQNTKLVLGGKVYGIAGTDELRRDLAIGLLWGTPIALFIGVAVAVGSVMSGLLFGIYSGYKGGKTDESMMRLNDIVYALPALPFLIILSVTTSSSIFLLIGFLMIFGWVGVAKVARSLSLQIKTRQYVDAAKIMGQKDSVIILKHILPQIMPYALASIAISVPAAITTEAGLSFLGLGDPTFPTWGHILHDAKSYGAAARGLWWWIIPPGMMVAITGLAFVFIGNSLEAVANPRLRR